MKPSFLPLVLLYLITTGYFIIHTVDNGAVYAARRHLFGFFHGLDPRVIRDMLYHNPTLPGFAENPLASGLCYILLLAVPLAAGWDSSRPRKKRFIFLAPLLALASILFGEYLCKEEVPIHVTILFITLYCVLGFFLASAILFALKGKGEEDGDP